MFCPCLFVCLSISKITQKRVHGFGWNVACRQLLGHGRTELLSPIRIMVRMPGPYCSLRYHIGYTELCSLAIGCQPAACYAEFYVGKIPHIRIGGAPLERAVVLKWFYSLLLLLVCVSFVINHNWSATKQRPHPQSVAEISRHSVLFYSLSRRKTFVGGKCALPSVILV